MISRKMIALVLIREWGAREGSSGDATSGIVEFIQVRPDVCGELSGVYIPVFDFGVGVAEGSGRANGC